MIRERFPGTASSEVKSRPRAGFTPSSENAPGVRNCILTRSAAPPPDSVFASVPSTIPSICSNDCACSCQSMMVESGGRRCDPRVVFRS
jgi:hypothetical protein